jgi:hypothetical protein
MIDQRFGIGFVHVDDQNIKLYGLATEFYRPHVEAGRRFQFTEEDIHASGGGGERLPVH